MIARPGTGLISGIGKKSWSKANRINATVPRLHRSGGGRIPQDASTSGTIPRHVIIRAIGERPVSAGDYVERDEIGRPIQVVIVGKYAVFFWADHPVKEVKVVDLKPAGG